MRTFKASLASVVFTGLLLAGCQSSRISSIDTPYEPLPAAPAGKVQQNQLPAPSAPAPTVTTTATDPSQFPATPTTPGATAPAAGTQIASASGPDVTVGSVAGVWSVSSGGQSCKVATPQTKYGQGFRAGPLKCPGEMGNVKSWNVAGKQLVFYDENGGTLARLYQSASGGFDGQTSGGTSVSLTR